MLLESAILFVCLFCIYGTLGIAHNSISSVPATPFLHLCLSEHKNLVTIKIKRIILQHFVSFESRSILPMDVLAQHHIKSTKILFAYHL